MQKVGYQSPELWVLAFEGADVITASDEQSINNQFDKVVEDFFGD